VLAGFFVAEKEMLFSTMLEIFIALRRVHAMATTAGN
jgi:hypothetical protein